MSIFRAYDIRGLYPAEINEALAFKIGLAATRLVQGRFCVARDVRTSSPALQQALMQGLIAGGAEVTDIGMVPSPVMYFATAYYGYDCGVAITASHNPAQYNGVKFYVANDIGMTTEEFIQKVGQLTKTVAAEVPAVHVTKKDVSDDYIAFVTGKVSVDRKFKVVIDAGNGATALIAPRLFKQLGCEVVPLYCEPDGRFPNHIADPFEKETLRDLQKKVVEEQADLGIAYDGDGDRVGVVNANGEIIPIYHVFCCLAIQKLKKKPGAVVLEVSVSQMVGDVITRHGGTPVLSKVGPTFIREKIQETGAILAGESSGHFYFDDIFGNDDGMFASLKMLELLCTENLDELVKGFPVYRMSELYRPRCDDGVKFSVVDTIRKKVERITRVIDIDGVRAVFDDGWFIIRASNTGPQLAVRWEAATPEAFGRIEQLVNEQLAPFRIDLQRPAH